MSHNKFGWDLPPGCSHADIERAFGDGSEASPEAEKTVTLLDQLVGNPPKNVPRVPPQTAIERIVEIVDNLALERSALKLLLQSTLTYLPERGTAPACTCVIEDNVRIESPTYCALHDGDWEEPTLREAVEDALKEKPV